MSIKGPPAAWIVVAMLVLVLVAVSEAIGPRKQPSLDDLIRANLAAQHERPSPN